MVERVVLLKLRPEHATAEGRAAIAERALAVLSAVPGVLSVTAGGPADEPSAKSWDLLIATRFASPADADAYRTQPDHRRFVDEFVAPRCEVRKAWTFAVETR